MSCSCSIQLGWEMKGYKLEQQENFGLHWPFVKLITYQEKPT